MSESSPARVQSPAASFPPFHPHPLLRGPHAQTIAGTMFPGRGFEYRAGEHTLTLSDGDQVILHEDRPDRWTPGDRVAVLVHGLAGCHQSGYMRRIAGKLEQRGVRVFRFDLRGAGAGFLLARAPYHSGRSEDTREVIAWVAQNCPGSEIALIGFSLGGNIVLKLAGEVGSQPPAGLSAVVSVCPPVDLMASIEEFSRPRNRIYDRHFCKLLWKAIQRRARQVPGAVQVEFPRIPRRLWEIDEWYTAPVCGFGTAENYYRQCSSAGLLAQITLPTLILAAADDPLIPIAPLERAAKSNSIELCITSRGGHLGFISSGGREPDRRWMDWRVVDWVTSARF